MPGQSVHGKDFYVSIATKALAEFVKTSSWEVTPDIHDITGSGTDDKKNRGGQIGRTFTMGGWYDASRTTGPAYLETIAGTTVTMVRRINGTGTGKPEQTCSVVVGKYVESQKNDDVVTWTCDFTVDGAVTNSTQA
jgi:hypothetical protein